ncbi:Hypothetical predicted protein [Octopus vulgaris]|uniref:Uncharacterized protein n=1 Tax=Octopus vulgaris TaxID=6645 RepID=A0AA36AGB3_OCTVU|nr:Hypothetical predicted protein [Octopus vulgaris]
MTALNQAGHNKSELRFNIWREMIGDDTCDYIDANKFANVRRDILRNNHLTPSEFETNANNVNIIPENQENIQPIDRNTLEHDIDVGNLKPKVVVGRAETEVKESKNEFEAAMTDAFAEANGEKILEAKSDILRELGISKYQEINERGRAITKVSEHQVKSTIHAHKIDLVLHSSEHMLRTWNITTVGRKCIPKSTGGYEYKVLSSSSEIRQFYDLTLIPPQNLSHQVFLPEDSLSQVIPPEELSAAKV